MAMTRQLRALALGVAAAAALQLAPVPAAAQTIDVMRSAGRGIERALRSQIGQALRPTLEVRNAYDDPPKAMAVAPDGSHLAVVTPDGRLRVFDLVEGTQVLGGRGSGFEAVAIGGAGRPVIVLRSDGGVVAAERWGTAPGQALRLSGRASAVAVSRSSAYVGMASGAVEIFDAVSLERRAGVPATGEAVTAIATDPAGDFALVGDEDGEIRVISETGWVGAVAGTSGDEITALVHVVGPLFAAGTEDGELAFIDASSAKVLLTWDGHDDEITGIVGLGNRIASADEDGEVRFWDGQGRAAAEVRSDWEGGVTGLGVVASAGLQRVVVAGPNDAIHLVDPQSARPLLSLFVTRNGWGAVDERGRFDGDAGALQDIAWRAGKLRLPVENLSARYFEPGLLVKHLTARAEFLTPAREAVSQRMFPPPVVAMDVVSEPGAAGQPIVLEIEAESGSAREISEIRLYHNGKRVPDAAIRDGGSSGRTRSVTATVAALPGENRLVAVARGWEDIDSVPVEEVVETPRSGAAQSLRITSVGIDRYAGRALRLNYAVADAKAVADQLARRGGAIFAGVDAELLLDKKASRKGIDDALGRLASTQASDVAVIFLAGHARTVGAEWYFLPRELSDLKNDGEVRRLGISGRALADALTGIPAQRVLLVVDACQSGAVLGSFESYGQRRALQELKNRTGVTVIAATRADQLAPEYQSLGHGLLTYVFLEGMRSGGGGLRADLAPRDGSLTAAELKAYVEARAPELAGELNARISEQQGPRGDFSQRVPVTPVGVVLGADFALAR
ncbi:hypothetical protein LNKW23_09330 [Paralimibaculum aggregatum]|uniref:Peptidase C14 caspase domain-containing protein n=1 Tax=Paralimibaculum aggregatum TaxID=3036245 RepID=A0ABQ6LEE3_9RHOB|nr:caspase family protein [Limibaculum sp. NKW23]GMG81720.1 hypothetical protein LNKW23_09330 [Limibaculum sp. NKW23]